jgi:hypothetical protein
MFAMGGKKTVRLDPSLDLSPQGNSDRREQCGAKPNVDPSLGIAASPLATEAKEASNIKRVEQHEGQDW